MGGFVLRHDYAVACFLMGLVVTLLGQTACWWLVRRLHRRSIIVFAMAGLMLLALAVVCYAAVLSTLSAAHEHRLADWGNICARGVITVCHLGPICTSSTRCRLADVTATP